MNKTRLFKLPLFLCIAMLSQTGFSETPGMGELVRPASSVNANPLVTPTPPALNAKAYILIDADSGKILAEKNSEELLPPASLTK
jgi:D-alanyl-D-alanine carboxypeptidase (penicillin-binding protein 5/6)